MTIFTARQRERLHRIAEAAGVDADYAKQHAVTSNDEIIKIFDRLKSKDTLWMSFTGVMSMRTDEFQEFRVGRKSQSKKYGSTTISLMRPGQTKADPVHRRLALVKRKGVVMLVFGDMWMHLRGIYKP
jgi:hypothetical protein